MLPRRHFSMLLIQFNPCSGERTAIPTVLSSLFIDNTLLVLHVCVSNQGDPAFVSRCDTGSKTLVKGQVVTRYLHSSASIRLKSRFDVENCTVGKHMGAHGLPGGFPV
jgi:hypothetical protein